mgnify:CR=1 FL=1
MSKSIAATHAASTTLALAMKRLSTILTEGGLRGTVGGKNNKDNCLARLNATSTGVTVTVLIMNGGDHEIEIEHDAKGKALVNKVKDALKLLPRRKVELYVGEDMIDPDKTLEEQDIVRGTVLHAVLSTESDTEWHSAARANDMDLLEEMLEEIPEADVNVENGDGDTPIHEAARNGSLQCVELLLDHGADVNAQNGCGDTPIHEATENMQTGCLQCLLERPEANVNVQNSIDETPIHVTVEKGYVHLLDLLLERREANVNVQCEDGNTPMHLAAREGDLACLQTLLKDAPVSNRADLNIKNKDDDRPIDVAWRYITEPDIRDSCLKLLLDHYNKYQRWSKR